MLVARSRLTTPISRPEAVSLPPPDTLFASIIFFAAPLNRVPYTPPSSDELLKAIRRRRISQNSLKAHKWCDKEREVEHSLLGSVVLSSNTITASTARAWWDLAIWRAVDNALTWIVFCNEWALCDRSLNELCVPWPEQINSFVFINNISSVYLSLCSFCTVFWPWPCFMLAASSQTAIDFPNEFKAREWLSILELTFPCLERILARDSVASWTKLLKSLISAVIPSLKEVVTPSSTFMPVFVPVYRSRHFSISDSNKCLMSDIIVATWW